MDISKRLKTVADFVTPCNVVADIGTDHGFVPIYMISKGIAQNVIAMDLRKGPLERAKKNIQEFKYQDFIETRRSDGLEMLAQNEADAITIAGMGGELMSHILMNGKDVLGSVDQLVLQPQSEIYKVRKIVGELGYFIDKEDYMMCTEKEYSVIHCRKGKEIHIKTCDYIYGWYMLMHPNDLFVANIKRQYESKKKMIDKLQYMNSFHAQERIHKLEEELVVIKEAFTYNEMRRFNSISREDM